MLRITLWEAEKIQLDGKAEGVWEKISWSFLASPREITAWILHSSPAPARPTPPLPQSPAPPNSGQDSSPLGETESPSGGPLCQLHPQVGALTPLFLSSPWLPPAPIRAAAHLSLGLLLALSGISRECPLTQLSTDKVTKDLTPLDQQLQPPGQTSQRARIL